MRRWLLVCALMSLASVVSLESSRVHADDLPPASEDSVDFVRDVQPLLRERCYSCHGPEAQESGLRLDDRKRALQGGDSGRVIEPGNSAASPLVHMVAGIDEDFGIMPPEGEGTPLSRDQVALLRAWIDQGATWPVEGDDADQGSSHWSFQSLVRPPVPTLANDDWTRNPIDVFVLRRLQAEGIDPSPEADRVTLIRRLFFDLLGLPPTTEQVDTFLSDSRPDAYERLVDETLRSVHYGERWGRHWLDLARYADTDGYEKDRPRPFAWRYRQWVIHALNQDMPFDQFSIEQIAGDMLPNATIDQRIASGFHRNTLHNTEGGADPEEDRTKKTIDRTNTISTIWLGLTVGCAQCHSHKYDPITQREYYATYAFFNSIQEADITAPLPDEAERYREQKAAFDRRHAPLVAAVEAYQRDKLPAAQAAWERHAHETSTQWTPATILAARSANGATLGTQDDRSILVSGPNERSDVYTVQIDAPSQRVTALRLEVLPDRRLPKNGPGRAENGNFVLTSFRVFLTSPAPDGEQVELPLASARADFSQGGWDVAQAINDDRADGWAISPQIGKGHTAVFELAEAVNLTEDATLSVVLEQIYETGNAHNIGRFRLSTTNAVTPVQLDGLPAAVARALNVPRDERTEEQRKTIAGHYRLLDPELAQLKQAVVEHEKRAPKPPASKVRTVSELAKPRETRVHLRGDFLTQGDVVAIGAPAVLPPVGARGDRPDRLDFAHWLFEPANPLTARVTVNRIWQRYFGRGIVATVDDFGTQGDRPTHPELLDWLACELRDHGWRLRHIHRLIVTSSVYRQSSAYRSDLVAVDPDNELLARQVRRRVEAEIIRDAALAVSGLLNPQVGGPSVRPPQPADYSGLTYANSARWTTSEGGDRYRRGLYTFFQRTSPYPMLMTFDSPDSTLCTAKRSTSNTPLQALTLLNDITVFECAQALGRRIVEEAPSGQTAEQVEENRARFAFRACLARQPSDDELADVLHLVRAQKQFTERDAQAAAQIVGEEQVPADVTKRELAAWVLVGRALMNLDEFVTRE